MSVPIPTELTNSTVVLKSEVRRNGSMLMGVFIVREAETGFQIYFLELGLKDVNTSKMKAYLNGSRARGAQLYGQVTWLKPFRSWLALHLHTS